MVWYGMVGHGTVEECAPNWTAVDLEALGFLSILVMMVVQDELKPGLHPGLNQGFNQGAGHPQSTAMDELKPGGRAIHAQNGPRTRREGL